MNLIILHGAPGVGKLTIGRELAKLTSYPLFHNHYAVNLAAAVFGWGTRGFIDLREQIWLSTFRRASQERLPGLIFTFVFEPTILPGFMDRVEASLGPDDVLFPVELRCDLEENERRVVQPERAALGKLTSASVLRQWVLSGDYRPPDTFLSRLVVDVTDLEPDLAAERIRKALD